MSKLSTAAIARNQPQTSSQASQPRRGTHRLGQKAPDPHPARVHSSHLPPAQPIADVEAYIDTLEIFFRGRRPAGLLAETGKVSRQPWFEDVNDDKGNRWGVRLICHQPSSRLLEVLDRYQSEHGGVLSRMDVAFDMWPRNMSTEDLSAMFKHSAILQWRPKGALIEYLTTTYFCEEGRDRNLALYSDKASKLRKEPTPILHAELRLRSADAIKSEKLYLATDLLSLSPRQIFDKHIRIVDFAQFIRRDVLGSSAKRRVRAFYDRFYPAVQLFKDRQPHIASRMKCINGRFILADRLLWGAKSPDPQ